MTRWRMPHEGDQQDRLWLAWPTQGYLLGDTAEDAETARRTWAAVANVAARFEPVTVVVHPRDAAIAPGYLDAQIELREQEIDDAWIRDSGPSFVLDENGALGAVTWVFNGWGRQEWARWDCDSTLAPAVADWAGAARIDSGLVNEGGGICVDGLGTVLVTETVQLDPGRNPGLSKADVEAELARTIGATKVIWLPRGLTRDSERFGTRGHVDIVAAIPSPGTLLVHSQRNPAHPDYAVSREIISFLSSTTDAAGREWNIIEVPAPVALADPEGFVDYSYINHVVVNGGVIACTFSDPNDEKALRILADAYPGRKVVGIDARELFARGGGIHCITQQQPAAI